ncbi:hypothetical protein [Halomonas halocynthiae]|uniref:hypothetical protein n=1 Tax=Halomonas halocynthiae TaxID=176290 RepID=UPI00040122EF|nr:hypothetical protein [Halomonas halocynthiae]
MPMPRMRPVALSVALLAFAAQANASSEQLEAGLRAMFANDAGELTIDNVSDSLFGGSSTAEGLVYVEPSVGTLRIDSYVVNGDFDSPDDVVIEGITFSAEGSETDALSADKLTLNRPDRAVVDPVEVLKGEMDFSAESVLLNALTVAINEQSAGSDADFIELLEDFTGKVALKRLEFRQVSQERVDGVTLEGMSSEFDEFQQLGAGSMSLDKLMMNGLNVAGMQTISEGDLDELAAPLITEMTLNGFEIDAEGLAASLESMVSDQDWSNGETGTTVSNLVIDLGRVIEWVPADERTEVRMVSNILTGGSNILTLNAEGSGSLEELSDGRADYQVKSDVRLDDALSLKSMVGLVLLTPEGMSAADQVMQIEQGNLELLDFESGKAHLGLVNQGLFNRLPAVAATVEGISEAEFIQQTRTQAKGMGNVLGPQVSELMVGLVDMMEGKASQVDVSVTLPSFKSLETSIDDPLGLPDKLSMKVEVE